MISEKFGQFRSVRAVFMDAQLKREEERRKEKMNDKRERDRERERNTYLCVYI